MTPQEICQQLECLRSRLIGGKIVSQTWGVGMVTTQSFHMKPINDAIKCIQQLNKQLAESKSQMGVGE